MLCLNKFALLKDFECTTLFQFENENGKNQACSTPHILSAVSPENEKPTGSLVLLGNHDLKYQCHV